MTRVLLLDTSFAARPIHDWLLSESCEVWVIGNRPNDVLARRDPAHYLQDNYADIDVVQAHVDRLGIDYVVPGCTDISIETAQRLTGLKTVLDSADTYTQITNKGSFRALCDRLNLPAPKRVREDQLPYPGKLIAKPVDAFSGRGIVVFDGQDRDAGLKALADAQAASRNGAALLETYVEGQLYSYSCFLKDHKVVNATIVREDGSVTPYAVDTSYVVWDFPAHGTAILKDATEQIAAELDLVDGLLHIQFIWDAERPWLIELSRRCPGDLYPRLVELSTGQPHAAAYAAHFVGRPVPEWSEKIHHVLRHTITAGHHNYETLSFNQPTPVIELYSLASTGREAPPVARIDRVALMFLECVSARKLREYHQELLKRSTYKTHFDVIAKTEG